MDEIEQAVIRATAFVTGKPPSEIVPEAAFADAGIDSLEFISLVRTIEEDIGIVLPDEQAAEALTIADLVAISRRVHHEQFIGKDAGRDGNRRSD